MIFLFVWFKDLIGPDEDLSKVVIEEDEAEKELHSALSKARKLKQKKEGSSVSKVRLIQSKFLFYISCTCV